MQKLFRFIRVRIMNMDDVLFELPITLDIEFTVDFGHALPLCILASYDKFKNWLFQNYMMPVILYTDINQFDCLIIDSLQYGYLSKIPPSLMRFSFVGDDIMLHTNDIVNLIKKRISKSWYCILFLDYFYIRGTNHYQKTHYAHEVLLYGYNDRTKIVQAVIFNNTLKTLSISYSEIELSYRKVFLYITERPGWNEYFLLQLNPIEHTKEYPYNTHIFTHKIKCYLNAQMENTDYYNELIYLKCEKNQCYPGIQMNKAVLEMLSELRKKYLDLDKSIDKYTLFKQYHPLHSYCEFHKALARRIQYWVDKCEYNDIKYNIENQYNEIVLQCERIRLLYIKISKMIEQKNDKGILNALNSIVNYAEKIYIKEPIILSNFVESIHKNCLYVY